MNTNKIDGTKEILLVEDSPDDAEIVKEALKGTKMKYNLNVPLDGLEALEFLHKKGKYANAPRPDLIILDLNLPKKDGWEVLSEIKTDNKLKRIPVIVLTTSQDEQHILKAYNLHANCYIVKPFNLPEIVEVAKVIEDWISIIKLPPE
ncbi:MAG: response regulator [Elusimicrobia bacterium]|nr:response regulator [Candidatus Obscuribacterium magneticum]